MCFCCFLLSNNSSVTISKVEIATFLDNDQLDNALEFTCAFKCNVTLLTHINTHVIIILV